MQLISCHDGRLLTLEATSLRSDGGGAFRTGLEALDALAPGGGWACGAMHELLARPADGKPLFVAMLLARSASESGAIIWCDPHRELYPPALAAHGVPLDRLFLLRLPVADQVWAVAECLRCKGVSAVVAAVPRLTRIEARRLQLAAETGGGVGVLLRPTGKVSNIYAAATRWLVSPTPGERTLQRWTVQLLHGHGGRLGQVVTLECCRETHLVRATAELVNQSSQEKTISRTRIAS